MTNVHDSGRSMTGVCLVLLFILIVWSCGASEEKPTTPIETNEPAALEVSAEVESPNPPTATEALMRAPDRIWAMAREITENGDKLYYGSFFLRPDATIDVSFESSGVRMELLYTEWRDAAIVLYYLLQYDADHNDDEGGGVWTPGPIGYYQVEFSTETILEALPANGGSLFITVQPTSISEGDIP